jgi:hypothetical protein
MSQSRNDMVLRPRLRTAMAAPREEAAERKQIERHATNQRGILQRLMRARATKAAASYAMRAGSQVATSTLGSWASRGSAALPVVAVGVVVASLVALGRIVSGKSFEKMGQEMNQLILGDTDEEARASMAARSTITNNTAVMMMRHQNPQISGSLESIYHDLRRKALAGEVGKSEIERNIEVQGIADILIARLAQKIKDGFAASAAPYTLSLISSVFRADPVRFGIKLGKQIGRALR